MLTKEQERQLVRKLAKDAPDGYVKDLLAEAEPLWIQAIDNDFCVANLRELWDQKAELRREIAELERRKAELDKAVSDRETTLARSKRQILELAGEADALVSRLRIVGK
jgi:chromosome segregation ATPase